MCDGELAEPGRLVHVHPEGEARLGSTSTASAHGATGGAKDSRTYRSSQLREPRRQNWARSNALGGQAYHQKRGRDSEGRSLASAHEGGREGGEVAHLRMPREYTMLAQGCRGDHMHRPDFAERLARARQCPRCQARPRRRMVEEAQCANLHRSGPTFSMEYEHRARLSLKPRKACVCVCVRPGGAGDVVRNATLALSATRATEISSPILHGANSMPPWSRRSLRRRRS